MEFVQSKLPCYPAGVAYETDNFRIVHYDWSRSMKKSHWRAYKLPSGRYVDGDVEYNTRKQAEKACLKCAKEGR